MLQRLARTWYHRRWWVVAAWLVLLVGLNALNSAAGGTFLDEFELPGSESQDAVDLLQAKGFDTLGGFQGTLVIQATGDGGVNNPEVKAYVDDLLEQIGASVPDTEVVSPYTRGGARQVSEDGTIAYAEINLADRDSNEFTDAGTTIREVVDDAEADLPPATRVELGGDIFVEPAEFSSEGVGLMAAVIILLIAFGSVLAMGLPIMTALFGIGCGIALVGLVVNVIDMPSFSNQAVAMIGIGVGIDYALFIVTRYREGLHDGLDPEGAVVRSIDTAGRAVLFAGTTVVIAVLGLFTIGLAIMRGLGGGHLARRADHDAGRAHAAAGHPRVRRPQHRPPGPARPAAGRAVRAPVVLVPVEPGHPAPALAGRSSAGAVFLVVLAIPARRHPAGVRRRRQPAAVRHHPPGLRPARPRASGRGPTGRSCSWPRRPGGRGRHGRARRPGRRPPPDRRRGLGVAAHPQRRRRRRHHQGRPHHRPAGQGDRRRWSTACATT